MTLGHIIRHSGVAKATLVADLGVTRQAVEGWVSGRFVPRRPLWPKLAAILGVDVARLRRAIYATEDARYASRATSP